MKYDPSGTLVVADSSADGLTGLFTAAGALRVSVDDGGQGLYTASGAIRVHDASSNIGRAGSYNTDGAWNVFIVDGTSLVGLYSANGAFNVTGISSGGVTYYLLTEDGGKFQLEDGSGFILLESAP